MKHNIKRKRNFKQWLGTICILLCSVLAFSGCAIADNFNKGTITGEDSEGLLRITSPWFNFDSSTGLFSWAFSPYSYSGKNESELINGNNRYTYLVNSDQSTTGTTSTVIFTGDPNSIQYLENNSAYYLTSYTDTVTGTQFLKATKAEGTYAEELEKVEEYVKDPSNTQTSQEINRLMLWNQATGYYCLQHQTQMSFDGDAVITVQDIDVNSYGFSFVSQTQNYTTYYNVDMQNGKETYVNANITYINPSEQENLATYYALTSTSNYTNSGFLTITTNGADATFPTTSTDVALITKQLCYLAGFGSDDQELQELISIEASEDVSVLSKQQILTFTVTQYTTADKTTVSKTVTLTFASQNNGITYATTYTASNGETYTATLTKASTKVQEGWINVADKNTYKALNENSIASDKQSVILDNVLNVAKYNNPANAQLTEKFANYSFVFLGNQTTVPSFIALNNSLIACSITEAGELVLGDYTIYTTSSTFAYTSVYVPTEENPSNLLEIVPTASLGLLTLEKGKTYTLTTNDMSFTVAETNQKFGDELSVLLGQLLAEKKLDVTVTTQMYFTWNNETLTQRAQNLSLNPENASSGNNDIMAQYATGKYILQGGKNSNNTYTPSKTEYVKAFAFTYQIIEGGASNIVNIVSSDVVAKIEYTHTTATVDSISNYFTKAELETILTTNIANSKLNNKAENARVLPTVSIMQDGVEYIYYPVVVPTGSGDETAGANTNYQLTIDDNRTVNIWFLQETTVEINGVYHTVLRKAPEEHIRARVKESISTNNTTESGETIDLSTIIANNMYIEFSPRLTNGTTTRNVKVRALALADTNRANSAYSNNITYNAYKMSFTTYSPNSITIDYGELIYNANKYYFYNVNTTYDKVLGQEMVTQLTGFFAEGTLVSVSRTTPEEGQKARDEAFADISLTATSSLNDYLRKEYSYALQSWSVNQKALNTFAGSSALAFNLTGTMSQQNIYNVMLSKSLLNDNVFFGVGTTVKGASVVVADSTQPYYVAVNNNATNPSTIYVKSSSQVQGCNFYANYTKIDNFSITGTVYNSEDLMGGASSSFSGQISYGLTTSASSFNLNSLNEFSVVGLSLEQSLYFKGVYDNTVSASSSTGYGYYFFLSDYVTALTGNVYQLPVIRSMGSISVFGDMESTGLIATKFHESTNLIVNVVAPSENDPLPNGTSYEVIKSITSSVDQDGYVVTTVIISVLVPDDSMLLAYNIDTNSVGYSSTRSFADASGNVVVLNEKSGTIYGAVLTLADGTTEVLKPTQIKLTPAENDGLDTLTIKYSTINESVVFTEVVTLVSDSAIVAPVYNTGIQTKYENSGSNPLPIYVTYDVQSANGWYFYTAPIGEPSTTQGSIDFYAEELALSYTCNFENSLKNLSEYIVSGTVLEQYLNTTLSETATNLEKYKHAFANLLGTRIVSNKYYFVKPLEEAKDALLSQQVQSGNVSKTMSILTLYTQDGKLFNGSYKTEELLDGSYTFTVTDASSNVLYTHVNNADTYYTNGTISVNGGAVVNLASLGYATSANGTAVKVSSLANASVSASFIDVTTGISYTSAFINITKNTNFANLTFTFTRYITDENGNYILDEETNEYKKETFTKSINDPELDITFTYLEEDTNTLTSLSNAWVFVPFSQVDDISTYIANNKNNLTYVSTSITYTSTLRYYYTTTDENGALVENDLVAKFETQTMEVEEGIITRKAVLKEDETDIIVLGKHYIDSVISRYNPTFSAWATTSEEDPETSDTSASIIGNKNGYYYLDYSSANSLSKGFPGVKYLDGAPYPNPVLIFNVRHKINEHSEISVGLLVKNVYQAELLGSFADTSTSSTFMDFTSFAFRSSEENLENSELLYSHAYVLRLQSSGFDYLYTNIHYRDESNQQLNTYLPLKIADIEVVKNADGTYKLVYAGSALAPNGSYYYQEGDTVAVRWYNNKNAIYEEKTQFNAQEFEELIIWSTSSNLIDNVGYQDIHTYYEGSDGRIHFTSDGATDAPCYGLANISSGDIHNGNQYDYSEVLFAGTATAFRSTVPGLIGEMNSASSGTMFDPNIWGYFINNMYPITISANSDTVNSPYFITNQETVVFVASPYLQFESSSSTSGVSSQGVLYRFKEWRIFERYNESIMYRAYNQEAAYSRYLNNAIFTFAPSTSGRYLILPVYERVYQVNVGTGVVGNTENTATNNTTFTPNQGGSITITYDHTTGTYVSLDNVTREEIQRKLFFIEYLEAFKQANISTIYTQTFLFAKITASGNASKIDLMLDTSMANYFTYFAYNSTTQAYNFMCNGQDTVQSSLTIPNGENSVTFYAYELILDDYGTYYIQYKDQQIALTASNIQTIYKYNEQGKVVAETALSTFNDEILPYIYNYVHVGFTATSTVSNIVNNVVYGNSQKTIYFTVENNQLYPTTVSFDDGEAEFTKNKNPVANLFTKNFNFVGTYLSTEYITFNNGWNMPDVNDYESEEDEAYKVALHKYQTQVIWGTTYFDRDTYIQITARANLGYRLYNFYFATYDATLQRYVFDASMTINDYLVANAATLSYADQIVPAYYNSHNNTYYFDSNYQNPVPDSYLDAVRGSFIQSVGASSEYYYTQVYFNAQNNKYYFDSAYTILAKVNGAEVTESMVTEKTYLSAITPVVEYDTDNTTVLSTRYYLNGVEVYLNPEDGNYYREISDGNYTVHNGTLTIKTLHENLAIVATFKEVYQQFIFAEPESASGIKITDIYYYNSYGEDKNNRTDIYANVQVDEVVNGFSSSAISIPLKAQAGATTEASTTLYNLLASGNKYTNKLFLNSTGGLVSDYAFGSYSGKHISSEQAQQQGITLSNMNMYFDQDCEIFVVVRVNAENKLETHSMGTNPNYVIECVVEPTETYLTQLQSGNANAREKYTYYILRYTYNRAPSNPYYSYIAHPYRGPNIASDIANATIEEQKQYYTDYEKKILKPYIEAGSSNFINLSTIELYNITVTTSIVGTQSAHDILLGDFFAVAGYGTTQLLGFNPPTTYSSFTEYTDTYGQEFSTYLQSFDIIGGNASSVNIYKATTNADQLTEYVVNNKYTYTWQNLVAARDTGIIFSTFNTEENAGATYNPQSGLIEKDGHYYRFMGWYERSLLHAYTDANGNRVEIWSDYNYQESAGGSAEYSHLIIADADKQIMAVYKEVVPFAFTYNPQQARVNFSYTTDSLGNAFKVTEENGLTTLSGYVDVDFSMDVQIVPVGGYRYNNVNLSVNGANITTWATYTRNNVTLDLTGKLANTNPEHMLKETLTLKTDDEENGSRVYDGASNIELDGYYATKGPAKFTLTMQEITPISIRTHGYKETHTISLTNNAGQTFKLQGKTIVTNTLLDDTQNPVTYNATTNTIAFYQDAGTENRYTYEISLNASEDETLNGYFVNNDTTKAYPTQTNTGSEYTLSPKTDIHKQGQLLYATVQGTTSLTFNFSDAFEKGYITSAYISIESGKGYLQDGVFKTDAIEFTSTPTDEYVFDNETHITIELYRKVSINDTTIEVKWKITGSQTINGNRYALKGYQNVSSDIDMERSVSVTSLPSTVTPIFVKSTPLMQASTFAQNASPAWATFVTAMASRSLSLASATFTASLQNGEAVTGYFRKVSPDTLEVTFTYATLTIEFNQNIVADHINGSIDLMISEETEDIYVTKATLTTNEGYVFENTNGTFTQSTAKENVYTLENVLFYQNGTYGDVFANLPFSLARTITVVANPSDLSSDIGIYTSANANEGVTQITYTGQAYLHLKVNLPENKKPYYTFEGWYIGNTLLSTSADFDLTSVLSNYQTSITVEARFATFVSVNLALKFSGLVTNMQPTSTLFTINVQSGTVYLNNVLLTLGANEITLSYFVAYGSTLRFSSNAQFTIQGNNISYQDATYTFAGFTQNELLNGGSTEIDQGSFLVNTSSTTNVAKLTLNYVQNITFTLNKVMQDKTAITSTRAYFEAVITYSSFPHLAQSYQVFATGETIHTYYGANLTLSLYYDTSMFTYNVNHASNISNGFTFTEGNQEAISATYNKLTYNAKALASASHHNFTFTFTTYAQMNFELQENVLLWQYYDATQEGWMSIPANGTLMVTNLSSVDIRLQLLHTQTITFVLESITVNGLVLPVAEATITQDDNGNTYYEFRDIAVTTAHISAQVTPAYEVTLQRYIDGVLQASTQLPLYVAHRHIQTETVPALTNAQGVYIAPTGSAVHIVAEQNNAYLFAGFTVLSMQGEVLDILPAHTTDAYITFTPTEPCVVRAEYVSLYSIATFTETRGSFTNTQVGGSISVSSQELYNQATQNTPFTVAVQANAGFTTQAIVLTYVENGTTVTKIFTPETFANGEFTINNGNGTFDIPYSAEQITFTAIFAQSRNVTITIQTTNGANGTVTINGQTVHSGETLTFTYNQALEFVSSADQGYVFAGWFLDEYTPISYNETLSMLATEVWLQNANSNREINIIAKFNTSIPSYNSHTSMSVAVLQADGSIAWQTNTLEWLTQNGNEYGYVEKQGYTFIGWYQEIRTNISNYLPVSAQSTYTLPVENKGEVLMVAMYAQNKQTTQTYTYQTWHTTHTWESAVSYVTQVGNVQTNAGQQLQTNVTLPERTNTQLTITNANGSFENVTQTQGTNASITITFTQTMYELTVEVYLPNGSLATQEQLNAWLLGNGSGTYAQNSNMFVGLALEGTNYAIAFITNNAGLQVGFQNTFTFALTQNTIITYTLKDIPQVEKPNHGTEIVDGAYHHYTFNAPAGYILSEVTIGGTTYTLEQLAGLSGVQNLSFTYGYASFNASTNVAGTFNPTIMVTGVAFSISEENFANVTASVTLQQILQINVSTSLQNDASAMYYIPYTSALNLTPWLNLYPGVNFAVYVNGVLQADSTNVTVEAYTYALQVYFEEITSSEYTIVLEGATGVTLPENESLLSINGGQYANNDKITLSTGTFYNIGLVNAQTYTLKSMKYTNGLGEVVTVNFTQAQNNTWSYPAEGIQAGSSITFTIAEQQNSFSIFIPIPWNELTQNEEITDAQTLADILFANNNTDVLDSIKFTLTQQSNGVWLVATYKATLAGSLTLYPLQQSALEFLENRYTYVSTKTGENNVITDNPFPIEIGNIHQTYYTVYTQEKAVYLATNRAELSGNFLITIQTNDNQYNNDISLAKFTYGEENARYYRFYIPANQVIHFTFTDNVTGNITNMSLFEIVMKNSSANIADFLKLYTTTGSNIQNNQDAYHNIKIQLNNPEQTLNERSATLTVQNATVLFLDFMKMQESIPDGYFIHGGVGSEITRDPDVVLNTNFSSTFNGGYYNFTTNGNYTVTSEKDSSYYIDTTTGLEKVEGSTNIYQPVSQNGGEVGVATNKTQTITFNAQLFGSTNTLVFKDTGETLTYAQQTTLKQIDNKLYAMRDGKNAEVVVKSSRSAIHLDTFKITANEQRLVEQNTTFTYQVNQKVTLTAYKQTNYRFVGFIAYMSNGTTINLPYQQAMDDTSIVYTTTLTVVGSIEQIEILYEGQISQITLRQIEISQESFDPSATGYTLSYNGKTPTYKGSFTSKEDILKAAVANKNTYIAGNYSSTFRGSSPDASMTALWQQILNNTFDSNIPSNTVFMAYYDGTSVNIYHFNTITLNEEGIVDLQWIVVSYLVTESQTPNEDGSTTTTHTFDIMNSYLGYTKGSLLVRESVTLSAYAYQYGEHIGWSLPNGLTNDIYDKDTVVTAQSVQNPTITQALTNRIINNVGNVVTFTIPNSVTIFTYFTTMRYLVTVDFADMENVTTSTYDSNNTNYLVFDTSNETYQEFFDSYYEEFGDYRVRIENGNQIVNEELGIEAPSIAANTLQLVRQSWLDMSLSKQEKQLVMNEKFAEDYFGVRNQQFALRVPQCVSNTTNLPTVNGSALYTYDMIDWGMYGASKQLSNFLQYFTTDDAGNLKLKENLLTITYNHTKFTNYSLQITQNTSTENNGNATGSIAIKFYIYANTGTGFGPLAIQGNPLLDSAYEIKNTVITYSDGSQKTFLGDNNTATGNVIVKNEENNIAEKTSDTVKAVNLAEGFNQWIYSEMTYDANGNPTKIIEPENVTITFIQSAKSSNVNTSVNLGTSLYTYQLLGQVNGSNNMADYTLSGYATEYLALLEHASKAQDQSLLYRLFGNDWKTAEKYGTLGVKNGEYYSNNSSIYSNYDITILKNAEYHAQTVRMWLDYYNAKGTTHYNTALLFMQLYQVMLSTQLTDLYYQEGEDANPTVYSLKDNFTTYIEKYLQQPLTNADKTVQLCIDSSSLIVANGNPVYFTGTISVPNFYNINKDVTVGNIESYASQIISAQDNNDTAKLETLWKKVFNGTLEIPIVYINIQSLYGSYFTQNAGHDIYSNNELLRILLTMDNSITLFDQVIVNTAFNEQYQMQLNDPVANTEADRKDKWFPWWTIEEGVQYHPNDAGKAYSYYFPGSLEVQTTSQEQTLIIKSELSVNSKNDEAIIENFADSLRNAFAYAFPNSYALFKSSQADAERSIVDFTTQNTYCNAMITNFTLFNLKTITYDKLFNGGGVGINISATCKIYQGGNSKTAYDDLCITKIYEYNPVPWDVYWVRVATQVGEVIFDVVSIATGVGAVATAIKAATKAILKVAAKAITKQIIKFAAKSMLAYTAARTIYSMAVKLPNPFTDPIADAKSKNPVYMDDIILIADKNGVPNYTV